MATKVIRSLEYSGLRYLKNVPTPSGGTTKDYLYDLAVGATTVLVIATENADEGDIQNFVVVDQIKVAKKGATAIPVGTPLEWVSGSNYMQPVASGDPVGYASSPAASADAYVEMVLGETILAN